MSLDAWITVIGAPDPVVRSVISGLAALDVRLTPRYGDPDGPRNGIVAFTSVAAALVDHIRASTDGRAERVLALSTSHPIGDDCWELLRAGASDVFHWDDPERSARHVAERLRRWHTIDELLDCRHVRDFLVGDSPQWRAVLREAVEVARFTEAAVLITGESGTGKERIAQLIHELDPRPAKKKLVVLDCSTIIPALSGSEFFGHEKGAFTGAATARDGAFELADGGTLFLDEVGELPVTLQAELLRVIQEGTFKRVGSNTWRKSRFRLVCATNRDLDVEQAKGTFRNDFYYRIAGCRLHLPRLQDRAEDILPLFRHFFRQVFPDRKPPELEDAVRDLLVHRSYPGNVRDLRSLVLRIIHRHLGDGFVTVGDIPDQERPGPRVAAADWPDDRFVDSIRGALAVGATLDDITAAAADAAMRLAAAAEGDDPHRAARKLGVPDRTVQRWQQARKADRPTMAVRPAGAGAAPSG
jgi:transcriptional regulator with GAF, ATPase, and Fis domain